MRYPITFDLLLLLSRQPIRAHYWKLGSGTRNLALIRRRILPCNISSARRLVHSQTEIAKQPVIKPKANDVPQLFPNDVAYIREKVRNMNDAQRLDLIRNVFKPHKSFPFPKSTDGRTFLFK